MEKKDLLKKIAELEFTNDQLTAELEYVDLLMRHVGFTDGLESLKQSALELYDNTIEEQNRDAA